MSTLTQVMHIVGKDARRFWPLAALVVGVLGLDLVYDPVAPRYIRGTLGTMIGGIGVRGVLFGVLTILLATLVVHEDEVSSGEAFWSSRPLSPLALLGAKVFTVAGLLLVVPLLFQAAAMLEAGTTEGLARHLGESALFQGGLLVMVMALAAATKDLKATLILGIVGYVGLGVMTSFWGGYFTGGPELAASRDFVGRVWWVAAGSIVLGYQFMTGRSRTALAGLVVLVSMTALVSARMPYDITAPPVPASALDAMPADMQIQEVLLSPSIRLGEAARDGIDVVVGTAPAEYALAPQMSTIAVSIARRGLLETEMPPGRSYRPAQRYVPDLGGYEMLGGSDAMAQFDFRILSATRDELPAALEEIDGMTVSAVWDAFTRRAVGRLPLVVGEELTEGPAKIRVERVELLPTSMEVSVTATWVRSALDPIGDAREDRLRMVLINDRVKQVLLTASGGTARSQHRLLLGGPRIVRQGTTLSFTFGTNPERAYGVTAEWFEDASVLVFINEYVGSLRAEVSADLGDWDVSRLMTVSRLKPVSTAPPDNVLLRSR